MEADEQYKEEKAYEEIDLNLQEGEGARKKRKVEEIPDEVFNENKINEAEKAGQTKNEDPRLRNTKKEKIGNEQQKNFQKITEVLNKTTNASNRKSKQQIFPLQTSSKVPSASKFAIII